MSQSPRLDDDASTATGLQSAGLEAIQATGPTAVILTSLPMETLQHELHCITQARPQLDQIGNLIVWLSEDPYKAALKASYFSFKHAFGTFTRAFSRVLTCADLFYEFEFYAAPLSLQDSVIQLLDPENQRTALFYAQTTISECDKAYDTLQKELIPLLVELSNTLKTWADVCIQRDRQLRERSTIQVPNILLDFLLGSVPPLTWTIPEIKVFLEDFAQTRRMLERLPSLVRNVQCHFLRLSEIGRDGIDKLGYTTMADIERLVEDRALCLLYVRMMLKDWTGMSKYN